MIKYCPTTFLPLLLSYLLLGVIPSQGTIGDNNGYHYYWNEENPNILAYTGRGNFERAVEALNRKFFTKNKKIRLTNGYMREFFGNLTYDENISNLIFYNIRSLPPHLDLTEAKNLNGFNKINPIIANSFNTLSFSIYDNEEKRITLLKKLSNINSLNIKGMISSEEIERIKNIGSGTIKSLFINISSLLKCEEKSTQSYLYALASSNKPNKKEEGFIKKIELPQTFEVNYLNDLSAKLENLGWIINPLEKGREIIKLIINFLENDTFEKEELEQFKGKIDKLIEKGADVNREAKYGYMPLHSTLRGSGSFNSLDNDEIIKMANLLIKNRYGFSLLHCAVVRGCEKKAFFLIKNKFDVNEKSANGDTPLHFLFCSSWDLLNSDQKIKRAYFLITHGANVNAKNGNGDTLLHLIFGFDHRFYYKEEKIKRAYFLITHGANVNEKNGNGDSPLHLILALSHRFYCGEEKIETANFLITHGANINAENKNRDSPLHLIFSLHHRFFYKKEKRKIATLLTEKGANVNAENKDGDTPLHIILRTQFGFYYEKEKRKIITLLIEKGANVNAENKNGDTPLQIILRTQFDFCHGEEKRKIVTLLIEKGANVNAENKDGDSPLHIILRTEFGFYYEEEKRKIVTLLIEKGANVNAENGNKDSPLHIILRTEFGFYYEEEKRKIVTLLIEKGANVNAENKDGDTPLHYAVDLQDIKAYPFLIENGADPQPKKQKWGYPLGSCY